MEAVMAITFTDFINSAIPTSRPEDVNRTTAAPLNSPVGFVTSPPNTIYEGWGRTVATDSILTTTTIGTPGINQYYNPITTPYYVQPDYNTYNAPSQMGSYDVSYVKSLEEAKAMAETKHVILQAKVADLLKAVSKMKAMPPDFFGTASSAIIYLELLVGSALGTT
jgi:hypothetical protein